MEIRIAASAGCIINPVPDKYKIGRGFLLVSYFEPWTLRSCLKLKPPPGSRVIHSTRLVISSSSGSNVDSNIGIPNSSLSIDVLHIGNLIFATNTATKTR